MKVFTQTAQLVLLIACAAFVLAACSDSSDGGSISNNGGSGANSTPPSFNTASDLPDGAVGQNYDVTLDATGVTTPLSFSVLTGSALPNGLTLSSAGVISGIPSIGSEGDYSAAIQVADGASPALTAARIFSITIGSAALSISPASLPASILGENYTAQLNASNGTAPYSFEVTSGGTYNAGTGISSLGNNTALSMSSTGLISTTGLQTLPAADFVHTFSVRATDSSTPAKITTTSYTIKFSNEPEIAEATLPRANAGEAYSYNFSMASGANAGPFTWSVIGSLPSGMQLSSSGELQGTPTSAGIRSVSVRASSMSVPQRTLNTTAELVIYASPSYTYSADVNEQGAGDNDAVNATDLGALTPLNGTIQQTTPLSIDDQNDSADWFRFSLPYQTALEAELFFDNSIADLDIEIYDLSDPNNPEYIGASITYSNDERVYLHGLQAGNYGMRISVNAFGPGANQYTFRLRLLPLTIITDYIEVDLNGGFSVMQQLQATNAGNQPSNPVWSIADGELITGLSLTTSGMLVGTPLDFDFRRVTLQVTDGNLVATRQISMRVFDSTRGDYWRARPSQILYSPGNPGHNEAVSTPYGSAMVTAPHPDYPNGALWVLGGSLGPSIDNVWVYHTDAMNAGAANRSQRLWKMEPAPSMTSEDPMNPGSRISAPRRYNDAVFVQHSYGGYIYAVGGEVVVNPGQHISVGGFRVDVDRMRVADGNGNGIPATGWETVASLPVSEPGTGNAVRGWSEFSLCVNDTGSDSMDRIFLLGGQYEVESDPQNSPDMFSKVSNRWVLMFEAPTTANGDGMWYVKSDADVYTGGRFPSVAYIDGRIYLTAGRGMNGMFDGIEMYQPSLFGTSAATSTADASNFPRLREGVYFGSAATNNGQMYFCGGWNAGFAATPWLYRFTPGASGVGGQLEALQDLDGGHGFGPGSWHDGRFWLFPGISHTAPAGFAGIFDYNPQ